MSETGTDLSESYALNSANTSPEGILYFESIDELWVANLNDNKWYRYAYTGSALNFLGTHDMHTANTDARGACYIPQEQTAACLNAATKQIFVYDASGAHVRTLSLNASQSTPRAMTVVGFELWVLDNGSDDAWLYDLVSDVSLTIETGYPNRYVQALGNEDPADTNDFPIRLDWNSVVTGFAQSDITLTGATLVSFRETIPGRQFEAIVRPPDSGSGAITVSVAANAVSEGNAAVSKTLNYTDAVTSESLFDWNTALPGIQQGDQNGQIYGPAVGLVVEASRVRLLAKVGSNIKIYAFRHSGTRLTSEDVDAGATITARYLDVNLSLVNNRWFANTHNQDTTGLRRDYFNSLLVLCRR